MAGTQALTSILRNTHLSSDADVLAAAETTLKNDPSSVLAQHVRVTALLRLDRHLEAVAALEKGGKELRDRAGFEHAYALYKSGRFDDAYATVVKASPSVGKHAIEAQIAYRAEKPWIAAEVYGKQLGDEAAQGERDWDINFAAVNAHTIWTGHGQSLISDAKLSEEARTCEEFEMAFNLACMELGRENYASASALLERAHLLCSRSADLDEDDKAVELASIDAQRVYALWRLGKSEEASKIAASIDVSKISDAFTRHIAQLNKIAAPQEYSNPYLADRLAQSTSAPFTKHDPFAYQKSAMRRSTISLALIANRYGAVQNSSNRASSAANANADENNEHSEDIRASEAYLGVFKAAAQTRSQTGKAAIKELLPLLEKNPDDVGLLMTIVHLYTLTNNSATATQLVESFFTRLENSGKAEDKDLRFMPGLVAMLVSLYAQQGRSAQKKAELAKATAHWRHHRSKDSAVHSELAAAAGEALLAAPATEEDIASAHELFADLLARDPQNRIAAAGMLASTPASGNKPAESTKSTSKLPTITALTKGLSADQLEQAGIPPHPLSATKSRATVASRRAATATKRPATDPATSKSSKRIRKSRLPKNYDENKQPDPERWLPLRERSTWRPKKGKKRGGAGATQGGLTQGGMPNDSRGTSPAPPAANVAGAGGTKKKKKKGGK